MRGGQQRSLDYLAQAQDTGQAADTPRCEGIDGRAGRPGASALPGEQLSWRGTFKRKQVDDGRLVACQVWACAPWVAVSRLTMAFRSRLTFARAVQLRGRQPKIRADVGRPHAPQQVKRPRHSRTVLQSPATTFIVWLRGLAA